MKLRIIMSADIEVGALTDLVTMTEEVKQEILKQAKDRLEMNTFTLIEQFDRSSYQPGFHEYAVSGTIVSCLQAHQVADRLKEVLEVDMDMDETNITDVEEVL